MFNLWYFIFLFNCITILFVLYLILRRFNKKTQYWILFGILMFSLLLHFTKNFFPPYSIDKSRMLRDSWFINICGANIALFPFFYISKSKGAKDYMFYLGTLGGLIAILFPLEVLQKTDCVQDFFDILRFYWHHLILFAVPFFMLVFKIHTLDHKRIWQMPIWLMGVCAFCMLNQVLQSELGFIDLRGSDIHNINYKDSSMVWNPPKIGFVDFFIPEFMKTVPFGPHAGEEKYWPLLWATVPLYVFFVPLCFGLCFIFDKQNIKKDYKLFFQTIKKNLKKTMKTMKKLKKRKRRK